VARNARREISAIYQRVARSCSRWHAPIRAHAPATVITSLGRNASDPKRALRLIESSLVLGVYAERKRATRAMGAAERRRMTPLANRPELLTAYYSLTQSLAEIHVRVVGERQIDQPFDPVGTGH